jgi:hypothetical protein
MRNTQTLPDSSSPMAFPRLDPIFLPYELFPKKPAVVEERDAKALVHKY